MCPLSFWPDRPSSFDIKAHAIVIVNNGNLLSLAQNSTIYIQN